MTVEQNITGDKPRRPEWRDAITRARAQAIDFWLEKVRTATGRDNAVIKAAQFMLGALNPDTYRERPQQTSAGLIVQFVQGETGKIVEATVRQIDPQSGKPLELSEATVPQDDR